MFLHPLGRERISHPADDAIPGGCSRKEEERETAYAGGCIAAGSLS